MKQEKMRMEPARYYDLIYAWKDYKKESKIISRLIQKHKKTSGNELLDVACGTANHIRFLKDKYIVTGIDVNRQMLMVAQKKFKDITFEKANMIDFNLGKKFDIITCLFSAIGYVETYENLNKTIASFAQHLKKGGVLIIEPFFTKESYHPGTIHMNVVDKPDVKICRMNVSQKRGNIATLDFHYLIATKKGIGFLRDKIQLALFEVKPFLTILKNNCFQAKFLKNGLMKGRGLYVAIKK
jgi:ubiquinone/menaquinone biosynthesis C-methylase UbiE